MNIQVWNVKTRIGIISFFANLITIEIALLRILTFDFLLVEAIYRLTVRYF